MPPNSECRGGMRFGHGEVVDGMLKDGLWDVYNDYAMGMCAELCADTHTISREAQVCLLSETHVPFVSLLGDLMERSCL